MSSVVGEVVYMYTKEMRLVKKGFSNGNPLIVSFFYTIYSHLGLMSLVVSSTNGI